MQKSIKSLWKRLVGYFLTGVFTILPLVITVAVVVWVAEFLTHYVGPDSHVGRAIAWVGGKLDQEATAFLAYWIGWIVVLGAILLLGMLVEAGARKLLHSIISGIVSRIPLASSVYDTAKQLVGMMDKRDDDQLKGMRVVFCTFGKESATGILALMPTGERLPINGRNYHIVYVPTSPIPMTGGILFVPADSIQEVEMSVDGLMSIYLSMGITSPQYVGSDIVPDTKNLEG